MAYRSVQPFLHNSLQSAIGHVLTLKIAPPMGDLNPSNTWFLGFTQLSSPNGISIGSAVFVQLKADSPYTLHWAALFPLNCPFPWAYLDPHLIHDSSGTSKPITQTASRPVQPFLHSTWEGAILRVGRGGPFATPSPPKRLPIPMGDVDRYLIRTWFLGPPESSTQMVSRSVQSFLQGSLLWQRNRQIDRSHYFLILYQATSTYVLLRCSVKWDTEPPVWAGDKPEHLMVPPVTKQTTFAFSWQFIYNFEILC